MMTTTKTTYFEAHEENLMKLYEENSNAYDWLEVIPKQKWYAFLIYSMYAVLMNNLSEFLDGIILIQRDKSIITIYEWIRN